MRGSITRWNKKLGCGFILGEDGFEAFFDCSSLDGLEIRTLSVGIPVEYQQRFGHERLRATGVKAVANARIESAAGRGRGSPLLPT